MFGQPVCTIGLYTFWHAVIIAVSAGKSARFAALIIGIGILGTALAYPLYFRILAMAGASNLLLVTIIVRFLPLA